MNTYLENDIIKLRSLEPDDIPLMYELENDTRQWGQSITVQPYSRSVIEQFIARNSSDIYKDLQLRLVLELTPSSFLPERSESNASISPLEVASSKNPNSASGIHGSGIGFVDLIDFSPRHLRAEVGIGMLAQYHNQGLGTQAMELLHQYASEILLLHQLYAYVSPDNVAAIRLFTKTGYQCIGKLQDWIKIKQKYTPICLFQKIF